MPSTYTPADTLALCSGYIRQMSIPATVTTIMLDQVASGFHTYQPDWVWTTFALTPITLVDGTQDYSPGVADGIYRLLHLRINRTDITPNQSRPIDIVEHLEPDLGTKGNQETIKCATYLSQTNKIRLETAVGLSGATTLTLEGEYQIVPTKITAARLNIAYTFPDHYIDVMTEGLLYKLYKYTDDDRAGIVQVDKFGNRTYTGQLAVWMSEMQKCAEKEDVGSGQAQRFPETPLGVMRGGYPGPVY
jgi:hypothetical protein